MRVDAGFAGQGGGLSKTLTDQNVSIKSIITWSKSHPAFVKRLRGCGDLNVGGSFLMIIGAKCRSYNAANIWARSLCVGFSPR